ncbi:thiolase family protein [Metabacillus herbersteinensis]|uniref:acetyl-CoA C-acetyltransferase n=1 Tax=Metabacillus herbersteinensis TaxID=283816 RepID=A0ABV6GI93_9BACI
MSDIFILEGARTPFGTFGGELKDIPPTELGILSSKEALKRSGIKAEEIEFSVTGNVIDSAKNSPYIARHIALRSGVPITSPALAINRLCGSGLQAVVSVAQSIKLNEGQIGLACGTENMSLSPFSLRGSRFGTKLSSPVIDDMLWATLTDEYCGFGMGVTAENLAKKYEISRTNQDEFAAESHKRASKARKEGIFSEEIVPVEIKTRKGSKVIKVDEHIRDTTTLESLSSLTPAFKKDGTVTAGNASGINDGAAALVLSSERYINENNSKPIARIVSWGIAGVEPEIMGIGPVPAIQQALKRANMSIHEIDLFEINEAFAAQYLAVEKELDLNREVTNVNGGAIALGHPVGASGARILYSLIIELRRRNKKYGVAALCIGGGQGIAAIVEAL